MAVPPPTTPYVAVPPPTTPYVPPPPLTLSASTPLENISINFNNNLFQYNLYKVANLNNLNVVYYSYVYNLGSNLYDNLLSSLQQQMSTKPSNILLGFAFDYSNYNVYIIFSSNDPTKPMSDLWKNIQLSNNLSYYYINSINNNLLSYPSAVGIWEDQSSYFIQKGVMYDKYPIIFSSSNISNYAQCLASSNQNYYNQFNVFAYDPDTKTCYNSNTPSQSGGGKPGGTASVKLGPNSKIFWNGKMTG